MNKCKLVNREADGMPKDSRAITRLFNEVNSKKINPKNVNLL